MKKRTVGRIVYPRNAGNMLTLAKKIYEKHLADGENSPLKVLNDYDWAVTGPTIDACISSHEKAENYSKMAEALYKQRDLALVDIIGIVKNSGSLLKSINTKNPKVLGEYGLTVNDSFQTQEVLEK